MRELEALYQEQLIAARQRLAQAQADYDALIAEEKAIAVKHSANILSPEQWAEIEESMRKSVQKFIAWLEDGYRHE